MNKVVKAVLVASGVLAVGAVAYSVLSERKLEKELADEYELNRKKVQDDEDDDFESEGFLDDIDDEDDEDDSYLDFSDEDDDSFKEENSFEADEQEDEAFECDFDDESPIKVEE